MSMFKEMFALAGAVMEVPFGEVFTLLPQRGPATDVNARRSADPSRQPFDFTGNFVSVDEQFHAEGRRLPEGMTRENTAPKSMIDVETAAVAGKIFAGDVIRRKDTGERFAVAKDLADDVGRTSIHLTETR